MEKCAKKLGSDCCVFVEHSSELGRTPVTQEVAGSSPIVLAKITGSMKMPRRIGPNLLPGALGDRSEKEDRLHDIAVELRIE